MAYKILFNPNGLFSRRLKVSECTTVTNCDGLGMQIVSSYIAEGDQTSAQTMLDMIPGLYALDGDDLDKYNDLKTITEMHIAWQQQGKSVFDLDSSEVAALEGYAANSSGKAARTAQGILNFAHGFDYCDCPYISDSTLMKSSSVFGEHKRVETGFAITAKPNPATSWVAFDYTLPSFVNNATLELSDLNGEVVDVFVLNQQKGQKVWDIRKVKPGIYIYTLKAGAFSESGKLVIK